MTTLPHFTVIIPAKDRSEYLVHTLRTCAQQDYARLEVIVSDDGSTDRTREVVEEAARKDGRIRYVTPCPSPGASVGMRDNFEFALQQVRPGYVLALGADDGLLPHAITGMQAALQATGQELLAWPTPVYSYAGARMPTSQLMLYRLGRDRIIDSAAFLRRQAKRLDYLGDLESPMFYVKGVASTRLVERVRERSPDGRFYRCPTPDGYSGIVLAGEVATYAFSGRPFSIYGISPTSQGMSYLAGDEHAKRRSEAFFRHVADSPMHSQLASQPYSPLISLMTADYLLTAADLPGWPGPKPTIDYTRLIRRALDELAHGLFSDNRMARELNILAEIAHAHGLGADFQRRLEGTRKYARKSPFEGNGISPSQVFLDGDQFGLRDIFDAAYFAYCAHAFVPKLSLSLIGRAVGSSLRYKLRSRQRGDRFPPSSSWRVQGS
jgi:glycosyltransferase involved in cell wall biosynthesis